MVRLVIDPPSSEIGRDGSPVENRSGKVDAPQSIGTCKSLDLCNGKIGLERAGPKEVGVSGGETDATFDWQKNRWTRRFKRMTGLM